MRTISPTCPAATRESSRLARSLARWLAVRMPSIRQSVAASTAAMSLAFGRRPAPGQPPAVWAAAGDAARVWPATRAIAAGAAPAMPAGAAAGSAKPQSAELVRTARSLGRPLKLTAGRLPE
jgi:hypothetical protein